jgi:hypothetical protein
MMSLDELQISFPLFFCYKNHSNDIIYGIFDSENVYKDEVFNYRFITFLRRMTQILHIKKHHIFGIVAL